ncbi:hypothetical protein AA958_23035 [Streptomyces sp. CNQ-509]|uniref:hypothetical protein n=1 Tax=Streptomyces sp. CNQ-509 TaxID=444103 RepID=UPI00062DDBF7|nr:hypothetical protein [Streptomyces sp. CNQ-509]AKH84597.1 hypothetical protein AA958_23035 [Streptomyces sp. CNQ-509]
MKKIFEALGDSLLARVVPKSEAHAAGCFSCPPGQLLCLTTCMGNRMGIYCESGIDIDPCIYSHSCASNAC